MSLYVMASLASYNIISNLCFVKYRQIVVVLIQYFIIRICLKIISGFLPNVLYRTVRLLDRCNPMRACKISQDSLFLVLEDYPTLDDFNHIFGTTKYCCCTSLPSKLKVPLALSFRRYDTIIVKPCNDALMVAIIALKGFNDKISPPKE